MGLAPLLSGWWVLIVIGVVGLMLLSAAALYVLLSPTKSAVTLPPRVPLMPVHPAAAWSPAQQHDVQPMTVPMGPMGPAFEAPRPVFQSPDHTLPLTALTGDMLDNALIMRAPKVNVPVASPTSLAPLQATTSAKPSSKAPLPLRPNATLLSATPPSMPKLPLPKPMSPSRTLPPPASRRQARPYSLAAMAPTKAAELLALQLDSDLPPAMQTPHAPDTERSLEEDDSPTTMTTWDSMSRGSA